MSLKVEHLSYIYNADGPMEKLALNDISLSIEDGDFIGIIGHTGSGKSTLIQHFNGLLRPTTGRVFLDGVDIFSKQISLKTVRQKVGMVFQYPEHQLFGETVYEDVAFGPKNMGINESKLEQRVDEALAMVELDLSLKKRSPFELSGGQKRRVAIAGVLAMQPQVLILDEPTAGLDPSGRDEILSQTKRMHEEKNTTIILVSHNMEEVARLAGKLIVLNHGKVALEGTPSEVFKQTSFLEEIGLSIPHMTRLLSELKQHGLDVRADLYTIDDAEKEIVKLLETR